MSIFGRIRARRRRRRAKTVHRSVGWRDQEQAVREARRDAKVFRNDPNMIIGGLGWTDQSRRNQR